MAFTPLTDTLGAYAATNTVSLSIGAVSVQPGGTGVVLTGGAILMTQPTRITAPTFCAHLIVA